MVFFWRWPKRSRPWCESASTMLNDRLQYTSVSLRGFQWRLKWVCSLWALPKRTQGRGAKVAYVVCELLSLLPSIISLLKCRFDTVVDRKRFWAEFIRSVNRVLVIYTRSPAAERIVQFIASFAVGHATAIDVEEDKIRSCNMENLCSVLLAYLLERANARSNAVRFRSCQIISAVLTSLPDHAEISERLYVRKGTQEKSIRWKE